LIQKEPNCAMPASGHTIVWRAGPFASPAHNLNQKLVYFSRSGFCALPFRYLSATADPELLVSVLDLIVSCFVALRPPTSPHSGMPAWHWYVSL